MHPEILPALQDYLNDRTLPMAGQTQAKVPGFLVKPYVAWSPKLPRDDLPKDMMTPLAGARLREDVAMGAIVPGGSRRVQASRSGYDAHQSRGGQIREQTLYFPIFFRSLKALPYEAAVLWYEDLMVELAKGIDGRVHPAIEGLTIEDVSVSHEPPDWFVLEAVGTLRYLTLSHRDPSVPLRGIQVKGFAELLIELGEVPGEERP